MSTNTVKARLRIAKKTESAWKSLDPVLLDGELAISTDVDNAYKIGNGTSKWSSLNYAYQASFNALNNEFLSLNNGGHVQNSVEIDDLTTGNLIVTGSGRFTNGLYGDLIGNASSADKVDWSGVQNKPGSYTPSSHTHDDRYYTENEVDTKLGGKSNTGHTHDDRYYTESEINTKVSTLQSGIDGKLSLGGGTLTGDLNFSGTPKICWNDGTYQQRIAITDDSTANTDVFNFQQSTDAGKTFPTLMTIKDNGTVVATTFIGNFTGNLTGNATTSSSCSGNSASATKATQDSDGNAINSTYLKKSGGTLTGALTFANGTWNTVGDDVKIGDINMAGTLGLIGNNGNTGIRLVQYNTTPNTGASTKGVSWVCTGDGVSSISGTLSGLFSGNLNGNATTATALTSSAGSALQPIYFSSGLPQACTYSLSSSVPANAKFTDTNTWRGIQNNLTSDSTEQSLSASQGKLLNETKMPYETILINQNLNDCKVNGFYYAQGGNTVTNKPSGVNAFGLNIIRSAGGWYTQILYASDNNMKTFRRWFDGTNWSNWVEEKITDTVYTHPTTSGNKHIPSGGSSGQILRWSSDGTAVWGADNNTTYTLSSFEITASATEINYTKGVTSAIQSQLNGKALKTHTHDEATTSTSGFMSSAMVTKLNGIATDATKVIVDSALSSTSTNPVQNKVIYSSASVSSLLNLLGTGTSTPAGTDYYIAQYAGGGTTTTTYHRRPVSALYTYIKSQTDTVYAPKTHTHTSANITDATNANTANMIVKRDASGNFSAGTITANVTGNVSGSSGSCTGNSVTATTATNLSGGTVSATTGTFSGQMASSTIKLNNKWTVLTNSTSGAIEWSY